jgi:UDP-N-acetylmuramate--alanine ligase
LVLAFQPHRYTRTRDCFAEFVRVIAGFDAVLLTEVYAAGEGVIAGADGRALQAALQAQGFGALQFIEDVAVLPQAIAAASRAGDVVIVMGAGSIGAVPAQTKSMLLKEVQS